MITEHQLYNLFRTLSNDIKDIENFKVVTHSGKTSPIRSLALKLYDEMIGELLDDDVPFEEAHLDVMFMIRDEITERLGDSLDNEDTLLEWLDFQFEYGTYIDFKHIKSDIYNYMAFLPLDWIHSKGLVEV